MHEEEEIGNELAEIIKMVMEVTMMSIDYAIEWLIQLIREIWREIKRRFREWMDKRRNRTIDKAQRKQYAALVDGKCHRESQALSANTKGKAPMPIIGKLKRGVNHVKTAMAKKLNEKTSYFLNTTSEQRKKDKKAHKIEKKRAKLQKRLTRYENLLNDQTVTE